VNRVTVRGRTTSWAELTVPASWPADRPLAVLCDDHADAVRAVAHHIANGTELLIVAAGRVDAQMHESLRTDGFTLTGTAGADGAPGTTGRAPTANRIWISTSGSTGRPKRVAHSLAGLTTVGGDQPARTWLCPYSPGTYAWWQVISLSVSTAGQDVVTIAPDELDEWPAIAARHGVTAASGTPTFWRQTLFRSGADLAALPMRQITLGGEPVDQTILDRLAVTFPDARITWIYASSETGAAITVHDGRAGFPRSWLDRNDPKRARLSIVDGQLVVASPHAASDLAGPIRTGDRAEIRDDRVLITGRLDGDEINVGGTKVSAGMVRDVLLEHDHVSWVRVTGARAPLVGRVVTAEIVAERGVTEADLLAWATPRPSEYALPRRIRLLDAIPMKETLKSDL
jgi:acyl-CoA synthetase (AMP-forming)/AMP-acid ligase II